MPPEVLQNLQQVYELVKIPRIVEFVAEERYRKQPFQGAPLDRIYSRHFKKVMGTVTEHEKMLAFGWVDPNAEDFWQLGFFEQREYLENHPTPEGRGWLSPSHNPVWNIVHLYRHFCEKNGRAPETTWELIRDRKCGEMLITGEALDQPERYLSYISPVTGKLLEFTHEELSPGNMWITVVDKKTIEQAINESGSEWYVPGADGELLSMREFEGTLYYYRVYGYEGIIRTGMLSITDYGIDIG